MKSGTDVCSSIEKQTFRVYGTKSNTVFAYNAWLKALELNIQVYLHTVMKMIIYNTFSFSIQTHD